jgi:import inner membrane translocase subunit TIM17
MDTMSHHTVDFNRNPCPDRILGDLGMGFATGAVGGSAFHFVNGLYHSPGGHRFAGGFTAIRMNAPRVGGGFCVWMGLYSTFDCAMVYARRKEDPWNAITAGACTGGMLSLRQGLRATATSAARGAAFLALIEGTGLMLNRFLAPSLQQQPPPPPQPENLPPPENPADVLPPPVANQELPGPTGFFGSLFGMKQDDRKVAVKSELVELELPSDAVPSFD